MIMNDRYIYAKNKCMFMYVTLVHANLLKVLSSLFRLFLSLHLLLKSALCVPFEIVPFSLETCHLVELTLNVAPGLMARHDP